MPRNRNRGYQQLVVWQDAEKLFRLTIDATRDWPFERKKLVGQQLGSVDSVHRNIAEGYCRKSIKEYLHHLNIALGSLGESVSAQMVYQRSSLITAEQSEALDSLAYKLENGLLKLVESLERKRNNGDWIDTLIVEESNRAYCAREDRRNEGVR